MTTAIAEREGPPRLGAKIVGPAAPEGTVRDEEYLSWESVRAAVVSVGKRLGTIAEVEKVDRREAPQTATDDEDQHAFGKTGDFIDDLIAPPFDFATLCSIYENSSALRQNIDALKTNVDGYGHRFEPVIDFTAPDAANEVRDLLLRQKLDESEKYDDLMELTTEDLDSLDVSVEEAQERMRLWNRVAAVERGRVRSFFDYLNPIDSFIEIRKATREERELTGNAGWEIVRDDPTDVASKISQVYRVPFTLMQLVRADTKPTTVEMRVRKDDVTFETIEVDRFFRRYVRVLPTGRTYYKQFGDPRVVSRRTGHYYESVEDMRLPENEGPEALPANEFWHWRIRSPISAYGIPRWLSALLAVLGSRAAEEVNFLYFDNKAIPPMVLLVSGGRVSEQSVARIENHIEERIKGRKNFHKIMILEGLPADADVSEGDTEHSGKLRLELKPLFGDMQQDALFQKYDANNVNKVGRVFRIPQILTGDTKDMNRSTAAIAKAFAEEQVFQPERDEFDAVMNRHFLPSINIHFWRFRSQAPVQRIPNDLVENATKALDKGAITPNEGRQLISDAFSIDLPRIDREWARVPPKLALAAARAGALPEAADVEEEDESAAASDVRGSDGEPIARGRTSTDGEDPHDHPYSVTREGDLVRITVLPGGQDGHTHEVVGDSGDIEVGEELVEGESFKIRTETGGPDGHTHEVEFSLPTKKRARTRPRRRRRANAAANAILALREAIREELEKERDDWLDEFDRTSEHLDPGA